MAGSVSPVLIHTIFHGDFSVVHEDEDDISHAEGQPRQNYDDAVQIGAILEVEDDLANKTSVLENTHKDKPVGYHQVLALLLAANIGDDKEDEGNDDAREGNQVDIKVAKRGTLVR